MTSERTFWLWLVFLSLVPVPLLYVFTATTLWGWFLVPLGLPPIGMAHGFGLLMLLSLFRTPDFAVKHLARKSMSPEQGLEVIKESLFYAWFFPPVVLAIGYAAHAWGM